MTSVVVMAVLASAVFEILVLSFSLTSIYPGDEGSKIAEKLFSSLIHGAQRVADHAIATIVITRSRRFVMDR